MLFRSLVALGVLGMFFSTALASFRDVDVTHPYFHAIDDFESRGIVKGYANVNNEYFFRPLQKLNRAEALKIIWEDRFGRDALRDNLDENFHSVLFSDVPLDAWFAPTINAAAREGIVKGYEDGYFYPGAQVTRAEFLSMVIQAYDVPEKISGNFASDDWGNLPWYEILLRQASDFSLLPAPNASPHEALSRAEAVEILYRTSWVRSHRFVKKYKINGVGLASFYHDSLAGNPTASGVPYDPTALTAAHRTFPFGTRLKVYRPENPEEFVVVEINDRGPYHEERILDLSRASFERIAHEGEGVVEVFFEVMEDYASGVKDVPEDVLGALSDSNRQILVPSDIAAMSMRKPSLGSVSVKEGVPSDLQKKNVRKYPRNFFEGIVLRDIFSSEIEVGTIINFSGTTTALEGDNGDKVVFFVEKFTDLSSENSNRDATKSQQRYEVTLSGRNFVVGIPFWEKGKWALGAVVDGRKYSKMAVIDVFERDDSSLSLSDPEPTFLAKQSFFVSTTEQNDFVQISWKSASDVRSKFVFYQGDLVRSLFTEEGITYAEIPVSFFDDFSGEASLSVGFYQAVGDGRWEKIHDQQFDLMAAFPDTIKDLKMDRFDPFLRTLGEREIRGRTKNITVKLSENAYVTRPDGLVDEVPLVRNGFDFSFRYDFQSWGAYVVEIVSDEGAVLFNHPVYASTDFVLPVLDWEQTFYAVGSTDPVVATLNWVNAFRKKYDLNPVKFSGDLNNFAQSYAEEMKLNDFLGHVSPSGVTFSDRIQRAGFKGKYGENLSMATTMQLGLHGLENSGSHRQNLLNEDWGRVGVGVSYDSEKKLYYLVQVFGE